MNRRYLLKALFALPVAAVAAPLATALAPKPKPFADGGIIPDVPYLVGEHRCELPVYAKPVDSQKVGTLEVEIHVDTSSLQRDLQYFRKRIEREIRSGIFLRAVRR